MMTTLPKQQFRTMYIWMLFVLLSVSACQPASTASPSTQPTSTQIPIIEPTSTEAVIPLPTFALPTATPVPTEVTSMLTPNGPWLVYLRNYPHSGVADLPDVMAEFGMLNQDGSGHTLIKSSSCSQGEVNDFLGTGSDSTNYMARFAGGLYLFRPSEVTGMLVNQELWYSVCHTFFSGDEKGGLLASFYQASNDASPELILYALPSGKIRDQFPLLKCSDQAHPCNFADGAGPQLEWSPNGQYLAFSAIWSGPSSDLFVYDIQDGKTRQLTSGPDDVGPIWWSPDGGQIIMGEIARNYPPPLLSSLWTVSVSGNEIRLLYSLEDPAPQGIMGWLDEKRFIVYEGTNLFNPLELPAYNLRLVDMGSGEITTMFAGSFVVAELDKTHETLAFYAYDLEARPGYEGPGVYLVSASNLTIRHVEGATQPEWDDEAGLFVTSDPCEDDPTGIKAFNYREEWKCLHHELPPESFSSPDGKWQVLLQDGLWLSKEGEQAVQVSDETPTQIIWRQDSGGFFFIANQILYYTSLPEPDVKTVDKYPGGDSIVYQWVGGN